MDCIVRGVAESTQLSDLHFHSSTQTGARQSWALILAPPPFAE